MDKTRKVGSLAGVSHIGSAGFSKPLAQQAPPLPSLTLPPLVLTLHHASIRGALPCPIIFKSPTVLPPVPSAPWKETPLTSAATPGPQQTVWLGAQALIGKADSHPGTSFSRDTNLGGGGRPLPSLILLFEP